MLLSFIGGLSKGVADLVSMLGDDSGVERGIAGCRFAKAMIQTRGLVAWSLVSGLARLGIRATHHRQGHWGRSY